MKCQVFIWRWICSFKSECLRKTVYGFPFTANFMVDARNQYVAAVSNEIDQHVIFQYSRHKLPLR